MAGYRSSKQTWRRSRGNCFGKAAPAALTGEGNANRAKHSGRKGAQVGERLKRSSLPPPRPPAGGHFSRPPRDRRRWGLAGRPVSVFSLLQTEQRSDLPCSYNSVSLFTHPSPESPHISPPPARFPLSCLSDPSLLSSSLVTHSSTSLPPVPEELPYIGSILFDYFLLFHHRPSSLILVVFGLR